MKEWNERCDNRSVYSTFIGRKIKREDVGGFIGKGELRAKIVSGERRMR